MQLALMYRCFAQGPGGLKSGTLMNEELAEELGWGAEPDGAEGGL